MPHVIESQDLHYNEYPSHRIGGFATTGWLPSYQSRGFHDRETFYISISRYGGVPLPELRNSVHKVLCAGFILRPSRIGKYSSFPGMDLAIFRPAPVINAISISSYPVLWRGCYRVYPLQRLRDHGGADKQKIKRRDQRYCQALNGIISLISADMKSTPTNRSSGISLKDNSLWGSILVQLR